MHIPTVFLKEVDIWGYLKFLNKIRGFGPQCDAQLASKLSKAKPVSPQLATLTW